MQSVPTASTPVQPVAAPLLASSREPSTPSASVLLAPVPAQPILPASEQPSPTHLAVL